MPLITDWLMVAITGVYVIATCFICYYNGKSAKATREQIAVAQSQFESQNRPYITCEYVLASRLFRGIRITNHGNIVARDVSIKVNDDFIDSLPRKDYMSFNKINTSKYSVFGIKQFYDFYFSDVQFRPEKLLIVNVTYYDDNGKQFDETFEFDLAKQLPLESVETETEKLIENIKEIKEALNRIEFDIRKDDKQKNNVSESLSSFLGIR